MISRLPDPLTFDSGPCSARTAEMKSLLEHGDDGRSDPTDGFIIRARIDVAKAAVR